MDGGGGGWGGGGGERGVNVVTPGEWVPSLFITEELAFHRLHAFLKHIALSVDLSTTLDICI